MTKSAGEYLLRLPLYHDDRMFREIVDTYRSPEGVLRVSPADHKLHVGYLMGLIVALTNDVAEYKARAASRRREFD